MFLFVCLSLFMREYVTIIAAGTEKEIFEKIRIFQKKLFPRLCHLFGTVYRIV